MVAIKKYLEQFPHFTPSSFENALPFLQEQEVKAGEYLLHQGKICNRIAFIEKGLFRLFYLHDGKEITTCFCKEDTITCSYQSMLTQQPSEMAIQAIEDSKVISFSYESLQKLYQTDLFWQQVGRLAAENEFIIAECYNRFLNTLSARDRYLQIMESDPELLQRVPLNYLATYLQITPETLSRIRKKISIT